MVISKILSGIIATTKKNILEKILMTSTIEYN